MSEPCGGDKSVTEGIPYLLFPDDPDRDPSPITNKRDNNIRFWIHFGLVILCFILAVVTFAVKLFKPMPYGMHADGSGRFPIPTRLAIIVSETVPGIFIFTLTYFIAGQHFDRAVNIIFFCVFILHYIHRGIIHPLVARYSHPKITIWIPLTMFILNTLYHYVNAEFIGSAHFCDGYWYDPRFLIGLILFIAGFVINRVADVQLILLRESRKDKDYRVPKGPLFFLISCPNYFGEGLQWFGWMIMTWSLSGLVWWLFTEATFVPRARHHHKWYRNQFLDYPSWRKALIPFLY